MQYKFLYYFIYLFLDGNWDWISFEKLKNFTNELANRMMDHSNGWQVSRIILGFPLQFQVNEYPSHTSLHTYDLLYGLYTHCGTSISGPSE